MWIFFTLFLLFYFIYLWSVFSIVFAPLHCDSECLANLPVIIIVNEAKQHTQKAHRISAEDHLAY